MQLYLVVEGLTILSQGKVYISRNIYYGFIFENMYSLITTCDFQHTVILTINEILCLICQRK